MKRACWLVIWAALNLQAFCAQEPVSQAVPASTPGVYSAAPTTMPGAGSTIQLSLYLCLLLGLFAGGIYLLRNGVALFNPKPKGTRKLNISETKVLGNRQFLIVAEYENRKMLLGVCPGRIEYLCTLSGPDFPALEPEPMDA